MQYESLSISIITNEQMKLTGDNTVPMFPMLVR